MGKFIDLTGQKFGLLTVLKRHSASRNGSIKWECLCECGNKTIVRGDGLKSGHVKSCGCLQIKAVMKIAGKNKTHGLTRTRQYKCWYAMIDRCLNPHCAKYKIYGGRGIKICDKWLAFDGFWEDMQEGYKDNLTLDRVDVNGNYEKSNCRWATAKQQSNNTRVNHIMEYNGEKRTISEWAELYNFKYATLRRRICELNWPIEKALTTPIK